MEKKTMVIGMSMCFSEKGFVYANIAFTYEGGIYLNHSWTTHDYKEAIKWLGIIRRYDGENTITYANDWCTGINAWVLVEH